MSNPIPTPLFIWPNSLPSDTSIICCDTLGNIYFNSLTTNQIIEDAKKLSEQNRKEFEEVKKMHEQNKKDFYELKKKSDEHAMTIEELKNDIKKLKSNEVIEFE